MAAISELESLVSESARGGRALAAFVGAGGKTSSMFALARVRAGQGASILVSTTTRILDPDWASEREGRSFGRVLRLVEPTSPESLALIRGAGRRLVLGASGGEASRGSEGPKLLGLDPSCFDALAALFDLVLVEADGARGLSIKAPAPHEPVVPGAATAVVGLVGLDALGASLDGRVAHRPELLGPLVGCAPGERIGIGHLVRLATSSEGLFKGTPRSAARIVILNKVELVPRTEAESCAEALRSARVADAVILGSFGLSGGAA